MRSRTWLILFTIFAPVTVPLYLLFLAGSNLLGGAFYIVIEASVARIMRRPISLTRKQMVLLAVPVLLLSPVATAAHLLLWFLRFFGSSLCRLGSWQTGVQSRTWAFVVGSVWFLAAIWTTATCINAAMGLGWISDPLKGRDAFVEFATRYRMLGDMPPDMQARRQVIIRDLKAHREAIHEDWETQLAALEDDGYPCSWLPATVMRRLTDLPWFFVPGEISSDGTDHSVMLLGPLLLAWILLIRWPGTFRVVSSRVLRIVWYAVRTGGATYAIYALVTWVPWTTYSGFHLADEGASGPLWMYLVSPATWLGRDWNDFVRPDWYLFNAGLWLIIAGAGVALWWLAWRVSPFLGWPRYYVAFLASRLLQRKRIAFFSVCAVTLCVAMMIIVISVMGGFVDSIRARAHGLLGDLVVDGDLPGFPYYKEFIGEINNLRDDNGEPIVVQATPLIYSYGILQFPETKKTKAVRVWGIRLDEYVRVNEFGKDLFYQNRFGGTTLGPQRKPVSGFDEQGIATLPDDWGSHYQDYLASLPPDRRAKEAKEYRHEPGEYFHGPGVIESAAEPQTPAHFEGEAFPGMIVGRDILFHRMSSGDYRRSHKYPRGEPCLLTVLPLTRSGDVSLESPPKPSFRYVDDSRTGIHEIDSMNVYVGFEVLQKLLSMEAQQRYVEDADPDAEPSYTSARCSQIQIKLIESVGDDKHSLRAAKDVVRATWQRVRETAPADPTESMLMDHVDIQTWEEMQHTYIQAIEKEKFLVLIMFGVISIVAVFLILCIFYMIVQEKTRDIGIIKSVGGSSEGVAAVFLAYGGAIGLVGAVLGSLLGIVFVEHINEVQDFLARLNPDWRVWSPETYSFDKIPDVWKWSEVIWISVLAIVASVAGAAFPAIRASRTWPVESLRYE